MAQDSTQSNPNPAEPTPAQTPASTPWDIVDDEFDPDLHLPVQPAPAKAAPAAAVTEPTPEPAKPKHSAYLLRMAKEFGLSDQEIEEQTSDQLGNLIYHLTRQRGAWENAGPRTQVSPPGPAGANPPPVPKQEEEPFEQLLTELEGGEYPVDERIAKSLKALAPSLKRVKELEQQVASFSAKEKEREAQALEQLFDAAFDSLPAKFQAVTGKGGIRTLTDPKHAQRRASILAAAGIDLQRDNPAQVTAKLQQATEALFGDFLKEPEPPPAKELQQRQERWVQGNLARPTHREHNEPKGPRRATRAVAEKLRAMGTDANGEPEGEEESTLA